MLRRLRHQNLVGFTLVECIVVVLLAAILVLASGVLLAGNTRLSQNVWLGSQNPLHHDAMAIMASIQSYGRRANLGAYTIYRIQGSTFTKALPSAGSSVAAGQALEIWYWQEDYNPLTANDAILETTNVGTHYVLYYLDGKTLKADFGQIINGVGGVENNRRRTAGIQQTQILTEWVNTDKNINIFNHQMTAGKGAGCVNTDISLKHSSGTELEVKFSTLLRSLWPR